MASINRILISQQTPSNLTPYNALAEKYKVSFDFKPFFLIEPLTSREFRTQRINILDYTAVIFSSRHAIDAYFALSEELRVKVPETMKYFCTTEAVAMYLQKHIVYRKRKIFFGKATPESLLEQIGTKHQGENFLITASDVTSKDTLTALMDAKGIKNTKAVFIKSVSSDMKGINPHDYDMIVFYNPADVKSLNENFPDFTQEDIKFVSFGKSIVKAMTDAGLSIEIQAPSPEAPSVVKAIELYLEAHK